MEKLLAYPQLLDQLGTQVKLIMLLQNLVLLVYKSIALKVKKNINVNIISPGFISTSMTDNLNEDQKKIIYLEFQ